MYSKTVWSTGDVITATKLNNAESEFLEATDETKGDLTISGGAITLDLSANRVFNVAAFNANITSITISNVPASGRRAYWELWLKQDGTARTVTWPGSVKFDGGVGPTFPGTNTKYAGVAAETFDGGTTWLASIIGTSF